MDARDCERERQKSMRHETELNEAVSIAPHFCFCLRALCHQGRERVAKARNAQHVDDGGHLPLPLPAFSRYALMYIGAWTEYRLAQEQARNNRHQDAAQPDDRSGSTRKGAGIYHPSMSNKGGMEVAGLPDRESFRRTLESALSSNLAADDAENISHALEPLMQRLPSIHPAAPSSGRRPRGRTPISVSRTAPLPCRQQKRKALNRRCGGGPSRYIYTHSDVGTRPAVEPTSDGTRSTRSGFSAASAPLDTAAGLEERKARSSLFHCGSTSGGFNFGGQYRPAGGSRSSHLPLIIDIRRIRRNSYGSDDTAHSGNNHRISNTPSLSRGASPSIGPNEACGRADEYNSSRGANNRPFISAPTHVTQGVGQNDEGVALEREAYDGGAAATILRMARKRDPVGLKADFEQFWTWKRKAPTSIGTNVKKGTPAATRTNVSSKPEAGGGGRSDVATSKLEALERMKVVYMAKEIDGCIPAAAKVDLPSEINPTTLPSSEPRRSDNVPRTPHCEVDQTNHHSYLIDFSGGKHLKLSGNTDGETSLMAQQNREGSGSDEAMATSCARDSGSGIDEFGGGTPVDVPDLELTESRIRQVEKYFSGSGGGGGGSVGLWGRRTPEVRECVGCVGHIN